MKPFNLDYTEYELRFSYSTQRLSFSDFLFILRINPPYRLLKLLFLYLASYLIELFITIHYDTIDCNHMSIVYLHAYNVQYSWYVVFGYTEF